MGAWSAEQNHRCGRAARGIFLAAMGLMFSMVGCTGAGEDDVIDEKGPSIHPKPEWVLLEKTVQFGFYLDGRAVDPEEQGLSWIVAPVEEGSEDGEGPAVGTIDQAGLFTAPGSLPESNQVRVAVADGEGQEVASHEFLLGGISRLEVTPDSAILGLGKTAAFSVITETLPADGEGLGDVKWLVEGLEGGNSEFGTVDEQGNYTAPGSVPQPNPVRLRAVSRHSDEVFSEALIHIFAGGAGILPEVETIPTRTSFQFYAMKDGEKQEAAVWKVNDVPGGAETTGFIDETGLYRAPRSLAGVPEEVSVQACESESAGPFAEVSFGLVDLAVTPAQVSSNTVGDAFKLTARVRFSDGREEDVTKLATTGLEISNPTVAGPGNGLEVVLGQDAGTAWAQVSDDRYLPAEPATALVEVLNRPDYELVVEPSDLRHIIMGSHNNFEVFLVADRGPQKGDLQSILGTSSLKVRPRDANGAVRGLDEAFPADLSGITALVDLAAGEIVMGGKPGLAEFEVEEEVLGKKASFSVRLVQLEIRSMVSSCGFYPGDSWKLAPCGPGEVPEVIPAPEWLQDPFSKAGIPNSVKIHAFLYDPGDYLSPAEIGALGSELTIRYRDKTGHGSFDNHPYPCNEASVQNNDCYRWAHEYYYFYRDWISANGVARTFTRDEMLTKVNFLTYPNYLDHGNWPEPAVVNNVCYIPALEGENTVNATLEGLSLLPNVPAPAWDLKVRGAYPKMVLSNGNLPLDEVVFPSVATVRLKAEPTSADMSLMELEGYDFKIKGVTPAGEELPPENVMLEGVSKDSLTFRVLFDQPGTYQLWAQSDTYPVEGWSDTYPVVAERYYSAWHNGELTSPRLTELHDALGGIFKVRLVDEQGVAHPAIPLGNSICAEARPDSPEKMQASLEFQPEYGSGSEYSFGDGCRWFVWERVRYTLVSGQALLRSEQPFHCSWAPPVGESELSFQAEVIEIRPEPPVGNYDDALTRVLPRAGNIMYVADGCDPGGPSTSSGHTLYNELDLQVHRELELQPQVFAIPEVAAEEVPVTVRIIGGLVNRAIATGVPVAPGDLEVRDFYTGEPTVGIRVAEITVLGKGALGVKLAFDQTRLKDLYGTYNLSGVIGGYPFVRSFNVGLLKIRGRGPEPDQAVEPIPLNASPKAGKPEGTTSLFVSVYAPDVLIQGPLKVALAVDWLGKQDTDGDFELAGFSRRELPPSPTGLAGNGRRTVMGREPVVVEIPEMYLGDSDVASPYETEVLVYGNLTDEWSYLGGKELELADTIPDVVSRQVDDLRFSLLDQNDPSSRIPLGSTTAYVLEATRVADLRVGTDTMSPSTMAGRIEAMAAATWSALKGGKIEPCDPIKGEIGVDDPSRDVFVHLDCGTRDDDARVGLLDMAWLTIDGKAVPQDGRAHDFHGESPLGRPSSEVESGDVGWRWFGIELDGVFFDPNFFAKRDPNSEKLFAFTSQGAEPYQVPLTGQGMVPGTGGTSGGRIRAEDGAFELLSRTPGVDFPGLDAGYMAAGKPTELPHWVTKGLEPVAVLQPLVEGDLEGEFTPEPRRVFTFSETKDWKSKIATGLHTRGDNSAFIITTRPARPDGSPLLDGKILKATLVLGEWPQVSHEDEGYILTARVDLETKLQATAVEWLVPIAFAATTGYIGALIERSSILSSIGVNVLVSASFVGADKALELGLDAVSGSAMATTTGKVTGKTITRTAIRLMKAFKVVFRYGKGLAQSTARAVINQTDFKPSALRQAGSMAQDAVGGLIGALITSNITQAMFNENTVGGAEAFAFDQLWVHIPDEAVTSTSNPDASRTVAVMQMVLDNLSGMDKPSEDNRVQEVAAVGRSAAYRQKVGRGPMPLRMMITPGGTTDLPESDPRCGSDSPGKVAMADFRLTVGGDEPTRIPFLRATVAGVSRTTEEATARIKIIRTESSIRMLLLDGVLE